MSHHWLLRLPASCATVSGTNYKLFSSCKTKHKPLPAQRMRPSVVSEQTEDALLQPAHSPKWRLSRKAQSEGSVGNCWFVLYFFTFHFYVSYFRPHQLSLSAVTAQQFKHISIWAAPFLNPLFVSMSPLNRHNNMSLSPLNRHTNMSLSPLNRHTNVSVAPQQTHQYVSACFIAWPRPRQLKVGRAWLVLRNLQPTELQCVGPFDYIYHSTLHIHPQIIAKISYACRRTGDRIAVGTRFSASFQTGPGVQPAT